MSKRDRRILAKLSRVKAMKAGRFNQKLIDDLENFIVNMKNLQPSWGSSVEDVADMSSFQVDNRRQFEHEIEGMYKTLGYIASELTKNHRLTRKFIQRFQPIEREYVKYRPDMNWVAFVGVYLKNHRESLEDAMRSVQQVRKYLDNAKSSSTFDKYPFGSKAVKRELEMIRRVTLSYASLSRMREQWLGEMRDLQRTVRKRNKRLPQSEYIG
jgi:hypothetical protein